MDAVTPGNFSALGLTASRAVATDAAKKLLSMPAPLTNAIGADVALNNSTFTTGPTVAQGVTGTWLVTGSVVVLDTAGGAQIFARIDDGTTVYASGITNPPSIGLASTVTLSAIVTAPAGNLRISCKSSIAATSKISAANAGANSSSITAVRLF